MLTYNGKGLIQLEKTNGRNIIKKLRCNLNIVEEVDLDNIEDKEYVEVKR
jgi:hypothetical protein